MAIVQTPAREAPGYQYLSSRVRRRIERSIMHMEVYFSVIGAYVPREQGALS